MFDGHTLSAIGRELRGDYCDKFNEGGLDDKYNTIAKMRL